MPTLAQFRQKMLELDPDLGQTHPIDAAGVAARSVTIAHLGNGRFTTGWGQYKQMLRPGTSTVADRLRVSIDFDPISGRFDFDPNATAYTDTTVTAQGDEKLELHTLDPFLLDQAIQRCLGTTRFLDHTLLPMNYSGRYWLGDLSWINGPGDIRAIYRTTSPNLTRNRQMEKWNGSSTAGALVPDSWTLAGTGATFARDSTNAQTGRYSLSIVTSGGNTATVEQTYRVMRSGVSSDSLRSRVVTGYAVSRSGTASSQRVRVTSEDAAGNVISTTNSSFHDGDDDWQELTAEHTVDLAAEIVRVSFRQEQNETAELDDCVLVVGEVTDDVRRNTYTRGAVTVDFSQGQGLELITMRGVTQSLEVESYRPFHTFDATRVSTGSADSDSHDAPLELVARGGLWRLYEQLPGRSEDQTLKMLQHRRAYERLAMNYLALPSEGRTGFPIPPLQAAGARRV